MEDLVGCVIDGKYEVISLIGSGGMGSVYLARHAMLGRNVALKVLHKKFLGKDEVVKRLFREAQAVVKINHPNVAAVIDTGFCDTGEPFLVMEYLEGENLRSLLARAGRLDLAAACGIMEPVLLALSAAHRAGVVHRDLKPDNIFITHRRSEAPFVKLIDFGISRFQDATQHNRLTQAGALLGTPAYMSPEQVRGALDVDQRSDIYSMGAILYQMLTGKLPFAASRTEDLLRAALMEQPIPPTQAFAGFPSEVEPLVMQSLSKRAEERPQSADVMLQVLRRLSAYESRIASLRRYSDFFFGKTVYGAIHAPASTMAPEPHQCTHTRVDTIPPSVTSVPPSEHDRWQSAKRLPLRVAGGLGVVAIGVIAALSLYLLSPPPDHNPASKSLVVTPRVDEPPVGSEPSARPSHAGESVRIEVRGVPEGAQLTYNNLVVPMNPFQAEQSDVMAPLTVDAEGFERFATFIVPSSDQVIAVTLSRSEAEPEAPTAEITPPAPLVETTPQASPEKETRRIASQKSKAHRKSRRITDILDPWAN